MRIKSDRTVSGGAVPRGGAYFYVVRIDNGRRHLIISSVLRRGHQ
jgi:hypothetical protein